MRQERIVLMGTVKMTDLIGKTVEIEPGIVIVVAKQRLGSWSCENRECSGNIPSITTYPTKMVSDGGSAWYLFDGQSRIVSGE